MTYKITPAHFGITTRLKWLIGLSSLACFVLPMIIFPLIRPSWAWSPRAIVAGLLTWLVLQFGWYFQHNYSLEVHDNSVRVGGRVVRKGHVRYLREIDARPWRGGPRLILSEHVPLRARLFGGGVVIPNGLPEYEQIKKNVSTWTANSATHAK